VTDVNFIFTDVISACLTSAFMSVVKQSVPFICSGSHISCFGYFRAVNVVDQADSDCIPLTLTGLARYIRTPSTYLRSRLRIATMQYLTGGMNQICASSNFEQFGISARNTVKRPISRNGIGQLGAHIE
jgi:hypothetical protein